MNKRRWTETGDIRERRTYMGISPFVGPLIPLFWSSDDVYPGFQN